MERKILFTDLDGTLLNDKKTISPTVKRMLETFHEKGNLLVFSSGRPLMSILEVRNALDLCFPDSYIIAYNGSLVWHCDSKQPVIERTLSMEDVTAILKETRALGIHCHTYEDDHIIFERERTELDYYCEHIHLPHRLVPDILTSLTKDPYKLIAIHLTDHALLEKLKEHVLLKTKGRVTALFSNDRYLEFYPYNSGKGNAVLDLCRHLDIPAANSAAIGDEANDIPMLSAAGFACAMANAKPDVKKAADYITVHDNNHDGICDLLEKWAGIERPMFT